MHVYPRDIRAGIRKGETSYSFYFKCPDCKTKVAMDEYDIPIFFKQKAIKKAQRPWWRFW